MAWGIRRTWYPCGIWLMRVGSSRPVRRADPTSNSAEDISQGVARRTPGDLRSHRRAPCGSIRAGRSWRDGVDPDPSNMLVHHQTSGAEHGQYPDRDLWLSSSSWPQRAVFKR